MRQSIEVMSFCVATLGIWLRTSNKARDMCFDEIFYYNTTETNISRNPEPLIVEWNFSLMVKKHDILVFLISKIFRYWIESVETSLLYWNR